MQVRDRFDFEFEHRVEPVVSYMICSHPRSGSSLLCELLANTLHAGMPAEYLRPDRMAMLKRRWGAETLDDYLHALVEHKTSPNGVFGLKAHWAQYAPIADGEPNGLPAGLRYIHVSREDRLRQAVSWVRALQTGSWSTVTGPELAPAVYDRQDIERKIARIEQEEAAWERFFETHAIAPHRIAYEELAEAPEPTTRAALAFLGVDLPADFRFDAPLMERQADELSERWVARYRAESAPADLTWRSRPRGSRGSRSP
jgi:LPS sulfotransferase NodH